MSQPKDSEEWISQEKETLQNINLLTQPMYSKGSYKGGIRNG